MVTQIEAYVAVEMEKALSGAGACDTACNRTVAGQEWVDDYLSRLDAQGLPHWTAVCREKFRFGSGEPVHCELAHFLPIEVDGGAGVLRVSTIPGQLPLLLGKDAL